MRRILMRWRKTGVGLVVASVLLAAGAGNFSRPAIAQTGNQRDCDSNAVITCGALTVDELKSKYQANSSVQAIYKEFGITSLQSLDGLVAGSVTRDGQVLVNNKVVATNAVTAGRQNMPGSTPIANGAAFKRAPSVSFASGVTSLPALVSIGRDNTFAFAVLTSCGNPVMATPVAKPPQPKPQPQPKPAPNFTITKQVRVKGTTNWQGDVKANTNDHVEFKVVIHNTGNVSLINTQLQDTLPDGLFLESNSVVINGQHDSSTFFHTLMSLGELKKDGTDTIVFETFLSNSAVGCGKDRLKNVAMAKTSQLPAKQATATVQVCQPQVLATTTPIATPQSPQSPAPPTTIAATGASNLVPLFVATSLGAGLAYNVFIRVRRLPV
ncbi:MAG: hypothetical protein JWS12_566 [Candidatus Saccharibacteria bacterium]|nr:hypothetical protein [Candidatus Saccharibacteria bacterium]